MKPTPDERKRIVSRVLADSIPEMVTARECDEWAARLVDEGERLGFVDQEPYEDFLVFCTGMLADLYPHDLRSAPPPAPNPPPAQPNPALMGALEAMLGGEPKERPLPPNPFHVTRYRQGILLPGFHKERLTNEEALQLGVWLCALADPTCETASAMLAKVATR